MSDTLNVMMVYMTFGSRKEAAEIAGKLVHEKLAACVNILGDIESVYAWKGKIEHGAETAAIAKTTADRFPALRERVAELHSYECPCIVAWPLADGHPPFLDWVKEQV